jgi:ParB family chromosome partitioning protein
MDFSINLGKIRQRGVYVRMTEEKLMLVDVEDIRVNPWQPRREFQHSEIEELASSIRSIGLIQPPVLRKGNGAGYELVAGERRLRALKSLGWTKIPAILRNYDAIETAHAALIENLQRSDLNALEVAEALQEMMVREELTQEQLAIKVGKKRSTVANYLRMMQLPASVQACIRDGRLTMGHAKAILALPAELQEDFCRKIVNNRLSVREAEAESKQKQKTSNPFLCEIEKRLKNVFRTHVEVRGDGVKGKIEISYYDLDQLDDILNKLEGA